MLKTVRLRLSCPLCGSCEVFYSCTPNCCFNHVCSDCGATFETATSVSSPARGPVAPPEPLPEPADPTAPCAKCESTAVYTLEEDGGTVCGACGTRLTIEYTEIHPA